jgi:G:T-mismatch repair DNA endonuclease (very short patch repair protein)
MRFALTTAAIAASLTLWGCATTPVTPTTQTIDKEGCEPAKAFELGPGGGVFKLGVVSIEARKGDLTSKVALEIARCPKAPVTKPSEIDTEALTSLPSTRIRFATGKAHGPLPVATGRLLRYCVDSSKLAAAEQAGLLIMHDRLVAAPHPESVMRPTPARNCVAFAHLSFWHHLKHDLHKAKKKAEEAKKKAEKLAKEAKKKAEEAKKKVEEAAKEAKEGVEKEAKKAKSDIKKAAKSVGKFIKKLADPCNDCKDAVGLVLDMATCGNLYAAIKLDAKCTARVLTKMPELPTFAAAICTAGIATVAEVCRNLSKKTGLKSLVEELKGKVCRAIKLCK